MIGLKIDEWIRDLTSLGGLTFYGAVMTFFLFLGDFSVFIGLAIGLVLVFLCSFIIRGIYFKTRPEDREKKREFTSMLDRLDKSSFPSVHSARTAILCTLIYSLNQNTYILIFSACSLLLIMFSRVYLKKHDVIDVIGGAVVGIAIAYPLFM